MQKKSIQLLTEGNVVKVLVSYATPIFIGNLFQQLYNTADSLIVGNFVGKSALAAVSSVGPLLFLFVAFFSGFSVGASIVIAREIGAKNHEKTRRAVHTTFTLSIILGIAMTIVGTWLSPYMLEWMKTPSDVIDQATTYTRIYFMGSSALIMYNMLVGILRAGGDTKRPLYYLIASSFTNITLDIVLITVFHMGVAGAAIATVIAEFLSIVLCLWRLLKDESAIGISLRSLRLDKDIILEITKYGVPTGIQGCVIDIANIMIQSYVNSFGTEAAAGIGAYAKVEGFVFLPVNAFSMALTTFISQNEGAKLKERVKAAIRFGINASFVMVESIGIIIYIFAPIFIQAFSRDPITVAYGVQRAKTCALFFCMLGYSHVVSSVCRGEGKPMMPLIVMLGSWCGIRVFTLLTLGRIIHDIRLANCLYPITWSISAIIFTVWLYKSHLYSFKRIETI